MAGIYLHIPFCKQACHYCNFHFSTSLKQKDALVHALLKEIELQKEYLAGQQISSIYLGGGTPSLLSVQELEALFEKIYQLHSVNLEAEVTLEANPDDIDAEALSAWRQLPINRLSIGIQSFADADLQFMNRAHTAREAMACLDLARSGGFENLTVDLIYGTPTLSDAQWHSNMKQVFERDIPHISCYCLTVEPKTALAHFVRTGQARAVDEEQAARQFELLMAGSQSAGYEQYEISNFAKPGFHARHNSSYWRGEHYLGLGPSAHSFNGQSRQWNVANNSKYIAALRNNQLNYELEHLTPEQRYNEYVMTGLRTIWGCQLNKINAISPAFGTHFQAQSQEFLQKGWMTQLGQAFKLTDAGQTAGRPDSHGTLPVEHALKFQDLASEAFHNFLPLESKTKIRANMTKARIYQSFFSRSGHRNRLFLYALGLLGVLLLLANWSAIFSKSVDFNSQVRPILNEHCINCHGGVKKSGEFSLMTRKQALSPTESGQPAIVPGAPHRSELMRRITSDDPEIRMPLEADPLGKREIKVLRKWIRQGAKWDIHWAYQPIAAVEVPKGEGIALGAVSGAKANWEKSDLDYFIGRKLRSLHLQAGTSRR